jgi:hypothetical protein
MSFARLPEISDYENLCKVDFEPLRRLIRVDPPRRRKNSQPAAARRVAFKMGRQGGVM